LKEQKSKRKNEEKQHLRKINFSLGVNRFKTNQFKEKVHGKTHTPYHTRSPTQTHGLTHTHTHTHTKELSKANIPTVRLRKEEREVLFL
jgi:hypothetical protein